MLLASGAMGLALAACIACTPTPAPSPTPTGFASAEEAFAAAEATYRAYIDAVNSRRRDQNSGPAPASFLTGPALDAELASEARFTDAGVSLKGDMRVHALHRLASTYRTAELGVCLDVTNTQVVDAAGNDATQPDRAGLVGVRIDVLWTPQATLIISTTPSEEQC